MSDQELGGHLEVISNTNVHVLSKSGKIVLSILPYLGDIWPKVLRTQIKDFVTIDIYSQEIVS
jgi:hypothetical protein